MSCETIPPTAPTLSRGEIERHLTRARARRAEATAALLKAAGRSVARALRAAARHEQRAWRRLAARATGSRARWSDRAGLGDGAR